MKKIYLFVFLLVANLSAFSQETLPYAFNFDVELRLFGWDYFANQDEDQCWNWCGWYQEKQCFQFNSGWDYCGDDYRQYLVSPQLVNNTTDSVQVRFKYKATSSSSSEPLAETFVVGYYTGSSYASADDFVWSETEVSTSNSTDWQTFVCNLPPATTYVAIAYTSGFASGLMVDDVLFRAYSLGITHPFEVIAEEGGTVSVTVGDVTTMGTTMVPEGEDLTYTITADPGYVIDTAWFDGTLFFTPRGREQYSQTIATVIAPHTLRVKFKHLMYTITLDVAEHGHVVPDGGDSHQLLVPWDTTVGFRIYPDEGYAINYLAVNNDRIWDNPDTVTIANIRANKTLHVTFAPRQYLVTTTAGAGGIVSPSGNVSVSGTQDVQFYIAANPGYVIDSVFVDGEYFPAAHRLSDYIYTFRNVHDDHTLSATFFHQPYIVHYTATEHGTLSVEGGISVGLDSIRLYYEDTVTFRFVADDGYELTDLQLNGSSLAVSNPYVLTHVAQNSLFHAVFTEKSFSVVSHSHGVGTVSPAQTGSIGYHDTVRIAVTPLFCMQTDSILFDDSHLAVDDTLCLTHLEGAHSLEAYFSQIYYTMDVQPAANGSIVGNGRVVCDGNARFRLSPDPCHRLSHFYLDGEVSDNLLRTINDTIWAIVPSVHADHVVSALFERLEYTVTMQVASNGMVTPSGSFNVLCDSTLFIEVIPDECHYAASFRVNGVEVNDALVRVPSGRDGFGDTLRYTLANIRQNYTVSVEFRQFDFPLVATVGEHGTISTTDTVWMACGQDTDVVITPDACYDISAVVADGVDVTGSLVYQGNTAVYTLVNTHAAHTLEVAFERREYTVSLQAGEHGTVLPVGDTTVLCGNDLSVVIVPDLCHRIDTIWLDGVVANDRFTYRWNVNYLVGDSAFYSFSNMSESHQIRVVFRPITYAHWIWYSGNGTVVSSVTGSTVNCGEDVTVTMTPDDCYYIQSVYRNGYEIIDYQLDEQGVGILALPDADGDMYISVVFEQKTHSVTLAQQPTNGVVGTPADPVNCGSDVCLSFLPDACYHLDSVMVGGDWLLPEACTAVGDTFFYWIRNIHSDVEVGASFSIDKFHFTSSEGVTLSVTDSMLECGQPLTVYAIQANCTLLDSIRLNGQSYNLTNFSGGTAYYSFDTLYIRLNPFYADCDLAVFFSTEYYAVTPYISGLGDVVFESPVQCGENAYIHINPADCQYLESVSMNEWQDYSLLDDTLLVIRNMFQDVEVAVNFRTLTYEVEVEAARYGSITGREGMVECGTDLRYTFTPDDCAQLDSVFLDGVFVNNLLDSVNGISLALDSISADHNLRAVFSLLAYQVEMVTNDFSFVNVEARNEVTCGDSLQVIVRPDECHYLSSALLDGNPIMEELGRVDDHYTLYNVRQNHSIELMFEQKTYPVYANRLTQNGELLTSDTTSILCGKDTTLSATPFDECYKIDSVYVNGTQTEVLPEYEFHSIGDTVRLDVYMHRLDFVVEVLELGHSSLAEGAMRQTVVCDSSLHLAFVPEEGYYIVALVVDGVEFPAASSYDFLNVHDNHTLSVKTEIYSYMVRTRVEGAGTLSPDSVAVNYGDDTELTIKPEDCQYLAQLTVNGQPALDSVVYYEGFAVLPLHHITADQTVAAVFAQLEYAVSAEAGEGGRVTPAQATVLCGESLDFRMIPDDCYHLESVLVDGTPSANGWTQLNGDTIGFSLVNVRANARIEAVFAKDPKYITVENGDGGTVQVSSETILCGDGYRFMIIPDSCRTLEAVTVNGEDVMPLLTYLENANPWLPDTAVYETADVRVDQRVVVRYGYAQPHHIAVSFLSNGNILSYNNIEVGCGDDTLVSLALDCHTLDSLRVDGVSMVTEASHLFADVISDHTVEAYFHQNQYGIEAVAAANGTIVPAGTTTMPCAGSRTYTITPAEGYYIESLIVDGEPIAPTSTYTFTNVRENHTIEPVFAVYTYLVDVETVGAGSVTPGDTTVNHGASVHCVIAAADCHSIDSVVVNGVNVGVVPSYDFTNVTEAQTLTAYFSLNGYTVEVGTAEHGLVVLDSNRVDCGGAVDFTVTADACYALDSVVVNGVNVGAVASYTIENIRENQTVDAYFSQMVYSVTVADNIQHGTVVPSAEQVPCGEDVTLTVQPDACYSVDSVLVNGVNVGAVESYLVSNINENQIVAAFFSINEYMVEVTASGHGTVTNTGENTVTCGNDFVVSINPDDCYQIGTVLVDGQSVTLQGSELRLEEVAADHQVEVTFVRTEYVQQVTSGFGGTVTPAAPSVYCGDNQTFVVTPINCYHIDTIRINGIVLPSDSLTFNGDEATFTLYDVRQINEISVRFAGNQYQFVVENHGNGTVHLEQNSVECDGEATFYILPAACEQISNVVLSGVNITENLDYHTNANPLLPDTAFYTISQMNEDKHLVIDYITLPDNHVAISYRTGSSTLYVADSVLACGESLDLTFEYDCYTLDSVLLDGENQGASQTLTVASNLADRSVEAFFSMNTYAISLETTTGGTIEVDGPLTVNCGDDRSFTIASESCHSIDSVVVNGVNVGAVASYQIENIRENQTVHAYFSHDIHTVEVTAGEGGTVTLDGSAEVNCGGSVGFTVTPDACFSIDSVVVNGMNLGNGASYTIENITEDQSVAAYFSRNVYAVTSETVGNGTILPEGISELACGSEITYAIAPAACHQIDSVVVNGVNLGAVSRCTVTGTDELGDQSVKAYFSARTYGLSLTAGAGGTVLPSGDTTVVCGANLSVSILPDECYDIENVMVDGVEMGALTSYIFENIEANHTLLATFVLHEYTLTLVVRGGGSVTPNVTTMVSCGSDFTFHFTPNEGYYVSGVVVDGDTLPAADSCQLTGITANHTVQPLFTLSQYAIVATAGEGGSVSPEYVLVDYQGRQTIRITAADCHHIDSVFVDGAYVGAVANYTFNNVTAEHTLRAVFAINTFRLTASVEGEGTITPVGDTMVNCGENVTYSVVPADGWHIAELLVDGAAVEPTGTYTFTDVRDHHRIAARFAINEYTVTATAGEGGAVTPEAVEASYGEDVTVVISADACYHIDSVFADGVYVGNVASYTFTGIDSNHTLSATFAINEYMVSAVAPEHGNITLDAERVLCGGMVTVTVAPESCHSIDSVVVNGMNVGAVTSYQIENIRENQTVQAYFSLDTHTVEVTSGEGGTVTLDGSAEVSCGGSVGFTVTPDACYSIDSVVVNGTNLGNVTSYTIENITENQSISAYFSRNVYAVTSEIVGNGTIEPDGVSELVCGSELTYTITPAACHQIDSVVVNGMNLGAVTRCMVTGTDELGDQSVKAYFSARTYGLSLTAGAGGSVTPSGDSTVVCGSDLSVSILPDECYNIENVTVDGVAMGALTSYIFENIEADHMLSATFVAREYVLTPVASEGGVVRPDAATAVSCGSDFTFHFIPNSGYYVSGVVVDGDTLPAADSCLLTGITAEHTVQPLFALSQYEIVATAGEGGSVSPAYTLVDYMGRQTVRITADDCYYIDSVFVDGAYAGRSARYSFSNVVSNHTLRVVFAINTYTLNASVEGEGTITPVGDTTMNCGESITYAIEPADGWHLAALVVDGANRPSANSYTFENIRGNHSIAVRFAINEFEITASAGVGGSVSSSLVEASYGDSITIDIVPDDCYHVDSVFVDNVYMGAMTSYTFESVTGNHTLRATFAMTEYTVAVLPTPQNGTITPPNMTTVNCGDSVRYSIVPDEGYHVAELIVDGVSVEASETYVFADIHANHRISARFELTEYTVTATAGEGGSVTPASTVVSYGDSATIEIAAAACHHIDSVFADDVYVGAVSSYTFRNIAENHTLRATFAVDTYTLTASVEGAGIITPEGETTVNCGENVIYTIAPETGWHLTEVRVDGEAVETADSYTFTDVRADHSITAVFAINEYTVTATAGEGGSVTPASTVVSYGDSATIEIVAADCYHIDYVFADEVYVGAVSSYTFRNIAENHTLRATFAVDTYTLTASVEGAGTITSEGETTVNCGESTTYTITPETGWHLTELRVDGESVEIADSYTFTDVRTDHSITAVFAINEYTVTATAGEGGSVNPASTVVNYGDSATIEIAAADCHHIDSVFADDVYVGAVSSYTFRNIDEDHTLRATFAVDTYTLTASVEGAGTITPEGETTVNCGESTTYAITPETGWHLTELRVDGESVETADSYTFTDVRTDHSITAVFAINEYTVTATAGEGGSVTPASTVVSYGDSATIEIAAADCHHIDSVFADDVYVGAVSSYTFRNIAEDHALRATFAMDAYDIHITVVSEESEVFYTTVVNVPCGTDTLVGVPLFYCYDVDSIVVNGVVELGEDSLFAQDVRENMDVVFYLSREQFVLVSSKQGNGTVSPMDTTYASCDDEVTYTFTPDEGWFVQNLIVDGESLGTPTSDSYTFYNIHENHTFEVVFSPNVYIITSSIDPIDAGNITPYGTTAVTYGDDQTFNIVPFPGYEVIDVEVDGESQGAITTYTFYHVEANHTIVAHLMTVGVDEVTVSEAISVWPNPVENVCHVQLSNVQNAEIQLFDVQGKLLFRKHVETDEAEIDLMERPSGMYLLRVVSDGKVIATRKVIRK